MTTSEMTPADMAAVCKDGDGFGGGNGAWWLIILLLFGWGRGFGGFGGFGGYGEGVNSPAGQGYATRADINEGFAFNNLERNVSSIENTLCNGFSQLGYNMLSSFNALQTQLADCCCSTKQAISELGYNVANQGCETRYAIQQNTRDIIDNQNANSRAILDFLTTDKINTLQAENQSLKFAASQTAQNAYLTATIDAGNAELIRRLGRDCPVPAYVVPNPNCCYPQTACNTCGTY